MTVTTTPDQVWARGATAPVTLPTAPAPPAPPTYYPPTTEGGRPGRGPRRRFPRWIAGAAVIVAVAAAGLGGGWALRGANEPEPAAPPAAAPTDSGALSPEQAKQQTCGAYKTLGMQWTAAYQKWVAALPQPWSWNDPAVKTATAEFDATATQVASQLAQLTAPNAPAEVTNAVRDARLKIVDLAASHGQTGTGTETDAKIDAVDAAMATANRVCGL